jgi:hypothetical protein
MQGATAKYSRSVRGCSDCKSISLVFVSMVFDGGDDLDRAAAVFAALDLDADAFEDTRGLPLPGSGS